MPGDGPQKGKTLPGICAIEDDQLRLCHVPPGKDRPAEFASKDASGVTLQAWKRRTTESEKIARQFFEALRQGKPEVANELTARFPKVGRDTTLSWVSNLGKHIQAGDWDFRVVSSKEITPAAIVMLHQSTRKKTPEIDLDPMALILQDGVWRVLPEELFRSTNTDLRDLLTEEEALKFRELVGWFGRRKEDFYGRALR
jgi:hypothetical protein